MRLLAWIELSVCLLCTEDRVTEDSLSSSHSMAQGPPGGSGGFGTK